MSLDEATGLGAMALFGEKYGEEVRVVMMGAGEGNRPAYSIELCGGTHVTRTGDIGLFRITSEGALAAGIRRIEAATGPLALAFGREREGKLAETAALLKTAPLDVPGRVAALIEERRRLEAKLSELQRRLVTGAAGEEETAEEIGGVRFLARNVGEVPPRELKNLADALQKKIGGGVVALVSTAEGKASVVVSVAPELTARFDAVRLVREAAAQLGGKGGGGRPDLAQAGGPEAGRAAEALAAVRAALAAA